MLQLPQATGNHRANGVKVSQRTVYDCKKIISRAFKYATDELELITENPMLGVTMKQPKSGRREVWTEEQFIFAYDNCSDPQLKLLISLMIALSSRIGECLALTWSDVYDNEDKHEPSYIRVYKQLVYRSEEFIKETNGRGILKVFDQVRSTRPDAKRRAVFHVTKTEKEIEAKTDRIYVAPEVIFMLRDYKLVQNQHKQLAGDSYIDDDLIFAHEDGTHISSQYADDMFSSFYKPLGLPRVDLYSLRHFSITKKLAINGHDYVSLAKDTAHRQLGTIQDYYETPEDSVRIDTAKAIGKFLMLYYHIGQVVNEHKTWGSKFIENLAAGIHMSFPNVTGYSARNLKYMAKLAATYPDEKFVQQAVAQIPWGHTTVLLDKFSDNTIRNWYLSKTIENGWSRNVLIHQIESRLYERQVVAGKVSNFEHRLASPQSELAVQTMKDPYIFDFIPFSEDMLERDIENALVKDVTKLLLELGTGFAFLGNQYHLNVGGDDFYIDFLFYNLNLRCYVVVELKTGEFKPEYAGQLNFYLSAVDGIIKHPEDNPSIGLLLCKSKNDLVAEYALKDMSKPIGVSEYKITSSLPENLSKQLPSIEDIQKRIKK